MKNIFTAILCLALAAPSVASAQDEHPGGWNFDIMGFKTKPIETSKSHVIDVDFIGLSGWGFGLNAGLNTPAGMNVDMGRSFHFFVSDLIGMTTKVGKRGRMSFGFGIDLKNFTMTGPTRFLASPVHNVMLAPYPEDAAPDHSRLRIFSTTYNIKYERWFSKKFRFGIGPELYIVRAPGKRHEIRNEYTTFEGQDVKERFKNIRTNKVGVNIVGTLQYRNCIGLYVKYTPTHYLSADHGPQFQSISTGFIIGGL